MRWKKSSEYSIVSECGRFHIAKFVGADGAKFLLWDGKELVPGCFEDPNKRKEDAERIKNASVSDFKVATSAQNKKLVSALRQRKEKAQNADFKEAM